MLQGLVSAIDVAGAGLVRLYAGARPAGGQPPAGALVAQVVLAQPAGTVTNGALTLGVGGQTVVLVAGPPTWARVCTGAGDYLFDVDVRLQSAPDLGQELVVQANSLYTGALLSIVSGTLSL